MSEFLKAYPHARQVTLDKVIESWLETEGSGASKKKSDVKAPTPSAAQQRCEQMTKEGGRRGEDYGPGSRNNSNCSQANPSCGGKLS